MEMHPQREKNELMAGQIVDAINAETMASKRISYDRVNRRAHLATALNDLRDLLQDKRTKPDTWETRNARLLAALRVQAMLAHQIEAFMGYGDPRAIETAKEASRTLTELIGGDTSKALHSIIEMAKQPHWPNGRARAISLLTSLLEEPPAENNEGEEAAKMAKHIEMMQTPEAPPPGSQSAATVQSLLKELDALTGLTAVKQEVRSLVNYLRVQRLRLERGLPTGQITN
jgi:hypothetical protein